MRVPTRLFVPLILGLSLSLGCGGGGSSASPNVPTQAVAAPSGLAYPVAVARCNVGTPMAAMVPSSAGGAATSYAVSPALPAGLSLNAGSGAIGGTPTAVTPLASYTITASNGSGSAAASLSIEVDAALQAPSGLSYSLNPAVYTLGTAIAPNTPTATGGAITSYTILPALPAGLAMNAATGVITGTPSVVTPMGMYAVTAANGAGTTSAALTLTVNAVVVAPNTLTYSMNPAVYTAGTAIAANVPSSLGGAVSSYAVLPALPAGLNLNPGTGLITGTPLASTAIATYTVTATNASGTAPAALSILVNPAFAAPVANAGTAQQVAMGAFANLLGSGTSTTGNPLTYAWTLTSKPLGSAATLIGANTVAPFFLADVAGEFVASLVVNDGLANSAPATVTIQCVANFSQLFQASGSENVTFVGNVVQAGSSFSSQILNLTASSFFTLTEFQLTNGGVVIASTTSASLLGTAMPGFPVGLIVTLNGPQVDNGFLATYSLSDPITGKAFTVTYNYGF